MTFLEYATTGDGQLTALQILALLQRSGKKASELFGSCARYPQVLINIPVSGGNAAKDAIMAADWLRDAVAQQEAILGESGRILVRPSGTEALIRVMVEAQEEETAHSCAQILADRIKCQENSV